MLSKKNMHSFQGTNIPAIKGVPAPEPALPAKNEACVAARISYVRESDFLAEDAFREVLSFERKQAERSRKSLLLMLLDLTRIGNDEAKQAIIRQIAEGLTTLSQEIRIKGWHQQHRTLGIIFSGNDGPEKEALREKITAALTASALPQVERLGIAVRSFPDDGDGQNGGAGTACLFYPEIGKKEKKRRLSLFIKRAMDIAGGIAGILLFSPLFLVLPVFIKATSKGPVLFKQERVGRHGEKFVFLKFRTMSADNDPTIHQEYIKKLILEQKSYDAGPGTSVVYKIKNDPRVTPIGRFLRKTSLDELPQFLNVLKGEMSLVGPRPPIPYELENYDLWHRRRVMEIKPGITGLWQVEGRSSTTFDEMVRLDLKYSKEWSIWMDIKILLKTPRAVLAGKGAY